VPQRKKQIDVVFLPVIRSKAMRDLDRIVQTLAGKDVVVTFTGESGTGKEIFARRLHEVSHRRAGPFVPINCAAIPEALFESELFGHERGAFTGASERSRGKIEAANGGTLFLDEIGEMPLGMQAKLLRFLESRKFMRVGGSTKILTDLRLVTATLRPIEDEVRAGRFRADLFYRIQGVTLRIPPLRDRVADIDLLVEQFVAQASSRHGTEPPRLRRATLAALRGYAWPGNVRELRNTVELLCLLREGKDARVRDLPEGIQAATAAASEEDKRLVPKQTAIVIDLNQPLDTSIEQILKASLALEGGSRSRAARRLGMSLRTMQRYVSRSGL